MFEQLQLRIAFWSFPEAEEDIRLYSCLANGSGEEFRLAEKLVEARAVKEPLQIGFHLSATIGNPLTASSSATTGVVSAEGPSGGAAGAFAGPGNGQGPAGGGRIPAGSGSGGGAGQGGGGQQVGSHSILQFILSLPESSIYSMVPDKNHTVFIRTSD